MATEIVVPPITHQSTEGGSSKRHVLLQGRPHPLGAKAAKKGTNFAIFSEDGTRVDLCLFDKDG